MTKTVELPELPHGCNSYIVKRKATGEIIGELFKDDPRLVLLKADRFICIPTIEHLRSLNI